MPEETNLEYRPGDSTHGMKGTVIPSARRDALPSDHGGRFDPHKPIAFNVVEMGKDGVERSVRIDPEDMQKVGGNAQEYERLFKKEGGKPAMAESVVELDKGIGPQGRAGIVDDDHLRFEQPVTVMAAPPPSVTRTQTLREMVPEEPYMPPVHLDPPKPPVPDESPRSFPLISPALGDRGAPVAELFEKDGEVELSKLPTPGQDRVTEFPKSDSSSLPQASRALMQAAREKVRFVGSFGRLSVPYNMVWRHQFTLVMMQFSEDGIFYEPQDAVGILEVWWRGNLFLCMPNVIYVPFPDGKLALSIFFVDELETAKRRKELGSVQRRDG